MADQGSLHHRRHAILETRPAPGEPPLQPASRCSPSTPLLPRVILQCQMRKLSRTPCITTRATAYAATPPPVFQSGRRQHLSCQPQRMDAGSARAGSPVRPRTAPSCGAAPADQRQHRTKNSRAGRPHLDPQQHRQAVERPWPAQHTTAWCRCARRCGEPSRREGPVGSRLLCVVGAGDNCRTAGTGSGRRERRGGRLGPNRAAGDTESWIAGTATGTRSGYRPHLRMCSELRKGVDTLPLS